MENQILERILITTFTLGSFKKRVKALKSRLSEFFFGGKTNPLLEQEEKIWLNSVGVGLVNMFSKDTLDETIRKLENYSDSVKPLTVYLSFEPSEQQVEELGSWVRDNLSKELMMDIKMDKELIAGCAFIWNGVYKDYSLRSRLSANRSQIATGFKQYLGTK